MEVQPGYKQTDVGVIPDDWDVKPAKQLGTAVRGGSPRPAGDQRYFNGSYIPWLTVAALTNIPASQLVVTQTATWLTEEGSSHSRTLNPGTLIIANSGATLGVAKILGIRCCANDGIAALLNLNKDVSAHYLAHFINAKTDYLRKVVATGNGQPNLNTELIGNFMISLPPTKAEQEAIAEALSDADALNESLEQLITKKRRIKEGAMQELLRPRDGWEPIRLGNIADPNQRWSFTGGPFGSNLKSSDYTDEGIRIIQLQNIGDGEFKDDYEIFTSPEKADELLSSNIYPGEILLSKMGDPVARACIIPAFRERYLMCSDGIRLAVDKKRFDCYFIYTLINAPAFRTKAANAGTGSTRKRIGLTELRNLELFCPLLSEQTAIAAVLSDMDKEITALEAELNKARQLKQGMMQELLTGKARLNPSTSRIRLLQVKDKLPTATSKPHNWEINEAVIIAVLARHFGTDEFPLARKRCTKLTYLLHRKVEREATGYLKKAAGPYNPATRYKGPEAIAQKNGYIRLHNNGTYSGFVAAYKALDAESYFQKWYGSEMLNWLEQFRFKKTDELELLATVDMAMEELRSSGRSPVVATVRQIIKVHPEWQAKLSREIFSDANIKRAIQKCEEMFAS